MFSGVAGSQDLPGMIAEQEWTYEKPWHVQVVLGLSTDGHSIFFAELETAVHAGPARTAVQNLPKGYM